MTENGETLVVGMGEIQVTKDPSLVLTCLGLGSCIGICAFDPVSKVSGMAHIVLPSSRDRGGEPTPKYADTGVPMLLEEMRSMGAIISRTIVKIAGGAQMSVAPGFDSVFKMGQKNADSVTTVLKSSGVRLAATDTGGNRGRTVRLYADTGKVTVTVAGSQPKVL